MIEFDISKCKTKAGYSAKLKKGRVLNLKKIIATFNVLLETPILVVIKVDDVEVIVHKHGELYFKNCSDTNKMNKISKEVYAL